MEEDKFNKLWKVKLLKELLKEYEKEDLKSTITRSEKSSLERDLRMIRYGFENGIKEK